MELQLKENTCLQDGKYRIVSTLGQGGFGITYLAEHTMLDKMVAIKEFCPKEFCYRDANTSHLVPGTQSVVTILDKLKSKFVKEAKNLSKLCHPNIITIHDIFQENGTAYYVMDYIEGTSLSQMVKEQGAMPRERALAYIRKVADAVGYIHSLSMNHLDVKPANIMVRSSDDRPVLIDFGLSKQYDASGGQTSTTPVGISHGYAPVEQYSQGGVATFSPQTDIYALGATLFHLLSGSVPPPYNEIMENGLPELPATVSKSCADAIAHAMKVQKSKRPASVQEFLSELNADDEAESDDLYPEVVVVSTAATPVQPPVVPPFSGFIDLGLSVKWAIMNEGAPNAFSFGYELTSDDLPLARRQYDEELPTAEHYKELETRCSWYPRRNGQIIVGYDVIGPNGKSIYFPLLTPELVGRGFTHGSVAMLTLRRPYEVCDAFYLIEPFKWSLSTARIQGRICVRRIQY